MRSLVNSYTDNFLNFQTTVTVLIVPQSGRASSPIEIEIWFQAVDVLKSEIYLISPEILIKVHVE